MAVDKLKNEQKLEQALTSGESRQGQSKGTMLSPVKYEASGQTIQLSPETVRTYLVQGNGRVTDQEVGLFINLCRYQQLNPFLREAYLIKYGDSPATMVTGKETFTKRASADERCGGWEAGIIIQTKDNKIDHRKGTMLLPGEVLLGGWARVYRKDWQVPIENSVSLQEYMRKGKDGKPMSSWASMPATMIRKVALVQALREAFPERFAGLYSPEEMPVNPTDLPQEPIDVTAIDEAPTETPSMVDEAIEKAEKIRSSSKQTGNLTPKQIKRFYAIARSSGAGDEVTKLVVEKVAPHVMRDGKINWEAVDRNTYDRLCTLFESGGWQSEMERIEDEQNNDMYDDLDLDKLNEFLNELE